MIKYLLLSVIAAQDLTAQVASAQSLQYSCSQKMICSSFGLKCQKGYTCQYGSKGINIGCCQPSYPLPTPGPSDPICGGFANQQCPKGYECVYENTGSIGKCKKITTPTEPTCGGFANAQCPEGYRCVYDNSGSSLGKCVKQAMCGGFAGAECPYGQTCKYLTGADYGYCY